MKKNKLKYFDIFCVGSILYLLYRKSKYYSNCFYFANKLKHIPDKLTVINLGSTGAYFAFDYANTNIYKSAMNLAGFTQVFDYDLKILKKYSNKIEKNATVFISCIYPIFCIPTISKSRKEVYNQFAKILGRKDMPEWDIWKRLIFLNFPFLLHRYNKSIDFMIQLDKKIEINDSLTGNQLSNRIREKLQGWMAEADVDFTKNLQSNETLAYKYRKTISDLKKIINYCREKEWKPVLVVLPYSAELNSFINKETLQKAFYNNLNEILDDEIQVLDYSHDKRFGLSKYYMDGEYLNKRGRMLFTKEVLKRCQEWY